MPNASDVTSREAVLAAMAEFDQIGREAFLSKYGFGPARECVVWNGGEYDPEALLGAAYAHQFPGAVPLRSDDFSGGDETTRVLGRLGFEVRCLADRGSLSNGSPGTGLRAGIEQVLAEYGAARAGRFGAGAAVWATFKRLAETFNTSAPVASRPTVAGTWSAGRGNWARIPWISFLDSRETRTTQRGVYPMLFVREDLSGAYLTLAQGVTEPRKLGRAAMIAHLESIAFKVRRQSPELAASGYQLDSAVDLTTTARLGRDYEHSVIAHKLYERGRVPDDDAILADLEAVLAACDRYIESRISRAPQIETDQPNAFLIYVGSASETNLRIGLEQGIWGFPTIPADLLSLRVGDIVVFASGYTGGSPRVSPDEWMNHTVRSIVLGRVTRGAFEDASHVWPDEGQGGRTYPHRFTFDVLPRYQNLSLGSGQELSSLAAEKLRMSAITRGQGYLAPVSGSPLIEQATSTRLGIAPSTTLNESPSRLGFVIGMVGVGLLMVGASDALGRTGHQRPVVPLFLAGLTFIFAPCAWRLTGTAATRNERIWVSVVLGLGLLASYVFRSPLIFDNFDELAHGATLRGLLDSRTLFENNPMLPVSPFYPGIELVTITTRWLTGLPLLLDQMVVLVLARIVLVLCVFLIVERACHSAHAGGIGALVYAANPLFYSLGAQYGYQTLALAFAAAVVYLLFAAVDATPPKRGGLFALALISIAGMVVSHHVTAWLTIGFLLVWAAGLRFIIDPPRRRAKAATVGRLPATGDLAHSQAGIPSRDEQLTRRKEQSRIVGLAALVGVVLTGAWIAFLGHVVTGYIGPLIQEGARGGAAIFRQFHGNRKLFQNSAGGGTPYWEEALIWAAAAFFSLIILISLYAVMWRKSVRGGRLRYLPAAVAATYPLAMVTNISSGAKDIGSRTTTFIFFGAAVVVGGWLAGRLLMQRRIVERIATIGVAIICFVGSTTYGGGPLPILVNGPYIVGAHERSLGAPSLALANWVSTHLPTGSHIAADRDNADLLNNFGQVEPVSPLNASASPAPLFFDQQLKPSDISLIRKDDIRYIVTDTRLTAALPLFGAYIDPSETARPTRLTAPELEKFNSIRGVYRIYDNGVIQVYDLSELLGERPLVVPRHFVRSISATGAEVGVLVLAILVAIVWLWRLRRRARLVPIRAHMVVCWMVGALAVGLFGAFAILLIHLPPGPLALLALLAVLALGLWPVIKHHMASRASARSAEAPAFSPVDPRGRLHRRAARYPHDVESYTLAAIDARVAAKASSGPRGRARRVRSQLVLACVGLALCAAGAAFAVTAAQTEWVPPPEISIEVRQGQPVASVDLGTAAGVSAHVAVVMRGHAIWSAPLSSNSRTQNVVLPAGILRPASHVLLVADGRAIRSVYG